MNTRQQCDVCTHEIGEGDGYLLTTRQVVTHPPYWTYVFSHQWSYVNTRPNPDAVRAAVVEKMAAEKTPWIVCANCAHMLGEQTDAARQYARLWWKQGRHFDLPGCGPVAPNEIRTTEMSPAVSTSGLPQPSQVWLLGRCFLPSKADFDVGCYFLCSKHQGILVPDHFTGIVIHTLQVDGDREALLQAVNRLAVEDASAYVADVLV